MRVLKEGRTSANQRPESNDGSTNTLFSGALMPARPRTQKPGACAASLVEHPFVILKMRMGAMHSLMKTLILRK